MPEQEGKTYENGSWSAWAAVTKYLELAGFNSRPLFLPALDVWKSKLKVLAHSVPHEGLLPDESAALLLLSLPLPFLCEYKRRDRSLFFFL